MRHRAGSWRRATRALTLTFSLAAAPAARAADLETLLQQPLDVANVALVVPFADDQRVITRWSMALTDPRPEVRQLAARALGVVGAHAAREALVTTLAAEQDPQTARELAWALLVVAGPEADEPLRTAIERLGRRAVYAFTGLLAEHRGAGILSFLPTLRAAGAESTDLAIMLQTALARDPQALTPLAAAALRERDAALWGLALRNVGPGRPLDPGPLAVSLSVDAALRDATLLHLAATLPAGANLPEVVEQALEGMRATLAGQPTPLALELLERARGRPPRESADMLRRLTETATDDELRAWLLNKPLLQRLTRAELRALDEATQGHASARLKTPDAPKPQATSKRADNGPVLATVNPVPADVIRAVEQATGCRPGDFALAVADVAYDRDGRPHDVRGVETLLSKECYEAAAPLLALSLGHVGVRATGRSLAVLPLGTDALACASSAASASEVPQKLRLGGRIREPRKLRAVSPAYPPSARNSRLQGIVVLEAQIAPSGCVNNVKIERSVDPRLDFEALRAVLQWRYAPTLLGGTPVPVIMTVTVNFKLS